MDSKRTFKAVLFDLDGTLIEFKFKIKESRDAIINFLSENGFDISALSRVMKTQEIIDEVAKQLSNSKDLSVKFNLETIKTKLSDILDQFEMRAFTEARPHPGSLATLKRIASENILTAVVTKSGRVPVDALLHTFGFSPYLSLIITRNEMDRLKPEPDGILKALQILRVDPDDSIFVGDSILDVQASKKAGVKCVAVATGLYKAEYLISQNPDYVIHRIEDLENIIFPSLSNARQI